MTKILSLGAVAALVLAPSSVRSEPAFSDFALFTISKSENRNEVHYAIRLNAQCAPVDDSPVFAYWQMHEKGNGVIEPILAREERAYGIGPQAIRARADGGTQVRVALRALPSRPVVVQSFRTAEGCGARAEMSISGAPAQLQEVHAVLAWPFGIDRLVVSGWSLADGHPVRDVLRP